MTTASLWHRPAPSQTSSTTYACSRRSCWRSNSPRRCLRWWSSHPSAAKVSTGSFPDVPNWNGWRSLILGLGSNAQMTVKKQQKWSRKSHTLNGTNDGKKLKSHQTKPTNSPLVWHHLTQNSTQNPPNNIKQKIAIPSFTDPSLMPHPLRHVQHVLETPMRQEMRIVGHRASLEDCVLRSQGALRNRMGGQMAQS